MKQPPDEQLPALLLQALKDVATEQPADPATIGLFPVFFIVREKELETEVFLSQAGFHYLATFCPNLKEAALQHTVVLQNAQNPLTLELRTMLEEARAAILAHHNCNSAPKPVSLLPKPPKPPQHTGSNLQQSVAEVIARFPARPTANNMLDLFAVAKRLNSPELHAFLSQQATLHFPVRGDPAR